MSEHSKRGYAWDSMRDKIIGLGEESTRKSYYPELQQRIRELHESEARFRAIFDCANDAIFVHDAETGKILAVNNRMCELYGYTQAEMVGADVGMISSGEPPYTTDYAIELIRRAATGEPQVIEWRCRKKSGELFWVEVSLRRANIEGFGQIIAVARDITDRLQAEQALRKSEARFRNLFELAGDELLLIANDGRIIEANRSACNDLGYSHDELLKLTTLDIVVGHTREDVVRNRQILQKEDAITVESYQRRKDGSTYPVEGRLNLLEYGDQTLVLAVVRDITERKRSEEAIQRRSRQLEVLSKTSRRLNAVLETPVILHEMVKSALEVCGAQSGISGQFVDGKIVLRDYQCDGEAISVDYQFGPGYGVSGRMIQTRMPYVSNDAEHDPFIVRDMQQELHIYNLAGVPIISRSGEMLGCLEIYNTRGHRPFDDIDVTMLEGLAASAAVALDNAQMITERQQAEEDRRILEQQVEKQKRQFYKDTIFSVTGGRLDICEKDELTPYLQHAESRTEVNSAAEVSSARHAVERFLRSHQLGGDRLDAFMVGVGEAITNAIKHGKEGIVYAGERNGCVWVGIEDHGTGIDSLVLPKAVLLWGYSTKPSMGLGYSVMLEVADRIHLKTDKSGTTIILEKNVHEKIFEMSLNDLPDTWENIK